MKEIMSKSPVIGVTPLRDAERKTDADKMFGKITKNNCFFWKNDGCLDNNYYLCNLH